MGRNGFIGPLGDTKQHIGRQGKHATDAQTPTVHQTLYTASHACPPAPLKRLDADSVHASPLPLTAGCASAAASPTLQAAEAVEECHRHEGQRYEAVRQAGASCWL